MNFQHLLVVTYGRSGSTLLQGLLNTSKDCFIAGENHNFSYGVFMAWKSLMEVRKQAQVAKVNSPTSPWFGADTWDEERFLCDARQLLLNQIVPRKHDQTLPACIGFKEIRYLVVELEKSELVDYLEFLSKLLPNVGFVVLTRDHEQVAHSAWWQMEDPEKVTYKLQRFEQAIQTYAQRHNNLYQIDYKDVIGVTPRLRDLYHFLGMAWNEENIQKTLATPHSYQPPIGSIQPYQARDKTLLPEPVVNFFLDNDVKTAKPGEVIIPRGTVLLHADLDISDYRLVLSDDHGDTLLDWGLPSPKLAQRYTDNPNAHHARFKGPPTSYTQHRQLHICLLNKQMERFPLVTIPT